MKYIYICIFKFSPTFIFTTWGCRLSNTGCHRRESWVMQGTELVCFNKTGIRFHLSQVIHDLGWLECLIINPREPIHCQVCDAAQMSYLHCIYYPGNQQFYRLFFLVAQKMTGWLLVLKFNMSCDSTWLHCTFYRFASCLFSTECTVNIQPWFVRALF